MTACAACGTCKTCCTPGICTTEDSRAETCGSGADADSQRTLSEAASSETGWTAIPGTPAADTPTRGRTCPQPRPQSSSSPAGKAQRTVPLKSDQASQHCSNPPITYRRKYSPDSTTARATPAQIAREPNGAAPAETGQAGTGGSSSGEAPRHRNTLTTRIATTRCSRRTARRFAAASIRLTTPRCTLTSGDTSRKARRRTSRQHP